MQGPLSGWTSHANTTRPKDGDTVTATPKRPILNRARAIREFCCECMGYALQKERGL